MSSFNPKLPYFIEQERLFIREEDCTNIYLGLVGIKQSILRVEHKIFIFKLCLYAPRLHQDIHAYFMGFCVIQFSTMGCVHHWSKKPTHLGREYKWPITFQQHVLHLACMLDYPYNLSRFGPNHIETRLWE